MLRAASEMRLIMRPPERLDCVRHYPGGFIKRKLKRAGSNGPFRPEIYFVGTDLASPRRRGHPQPPAVTATLARTTKRLSSGRTAEARPLRIAICGNSWRQRYADTKRHG